VPVITSVRGFVTPAGSTAGPPVVPVVAPVVAPVVSARAVPPPDPSS
jgi:hypothetical protein